MARDRNSEPDAAHKAEYVLKGNTLKVTGQLDSSQEHGFREHGLKLTAAKKKEVVVDLTGVSYISSACLGTILVLHEELANAGHSLKIRLPHALLYVYDLMGIRNVIETEVVG